MLRAVARRQVEKADAFNEAKEKEAADVRKPNGTQKTSNVASEQLAREHALRERELELERRERENELERRRMFEELRQREVQLVSDPTLLSEAGSPGIHEFAAESANEGGDSEADAGTGSAAASAAAIENRRLRRELQDLRAHESRRVRAEPHDDSVLRASPALRTQPMAPSSHESSSPERPAQTEAVIHEEGSPGSEGRESSVAEVGDSGDSMADGEPQERAAEPESEGEGLEDGRDEPPLSCVEGSANGRAEEDESEGGGSSGSASGSGDSSDKSSDKSSDSEGSSSPGASPTRAATAPAAVEPSGPPPPGSDSDGSSSRE